MKALLPIAVLAASLVMAGATAQYQITENKDDIKELQHDREMQIRMEERQIIIKEDLDEIKVILWELKR